MLKKISKVFFSKTLKRYLEKNFNVGGIETSVDSFFRRLMFFSFVAMIFSLVYSLIKVTYLQTLGGLNIIIVLLSSSLILLVAYFYIFLGFFLVVLNLKIHERTKQIEEVLPNFLQLVSANVRAGLPIDKAMWLSVRPRFGVLAKEIENAAKETMTGNELEQSLLNLSNKYDSPLLQRTVNLIVEGLKAGGEIGDLLDRIATDIQETHLIRQEMAENVTTYVIFISFTVLLAAPMLFGLSYGLLTVVQSITGNLADVGTSSLTNMPIKFSGPGIEMSDFKIFAITSLILTSFFSSLMIATIKKGTSKEGLKSFPWFAVITVILYLLMTKAVGYVFGNLL